MQHQSKLRRMLFVLLLALPLGSIAQDSLGIFKSDGPLEVTISTDVRKLVNEKANETVGTAVFSIKLPDSVVYTSPVSIKARGHFRKEYCQIPPVNIGFKNAKYPLNKIKTLRLVNACRSGSMYEQLVFKEYLCYKFFNLLTPKSLNVRLVHVSFLDSLNKRKPFVYYGFVIEDMDAMAKRNDAKEVKREKLHTELTNRDYMTLVAMFQYMIGNTDWSVPAVHNIHFMAPKDSLSDRPYAIPYDFDYSGIVNAPYAVPDEQLGTTQITERVYRGYPRKIEELNEKVALFNQKKDAMYKLINDCAWLEKNTKADMIGYMEEFYKTINDPRGVKQVFIDNARRD